ncbi:hypothetical protein HDU96_007772 [Phlyctochytrium bullatum]|nr:hypothetical protein HDU96_007772 [Phlyctochytrium bullatum]
MTCASCVRSIETALKSHPAVHSATVALLAEEAKVTYDPTLLTTPDAVAALIIAAGFDAIPHPDHQTAHLQIFGMHCASCVSKIERELAALPGVVSARVDLLRQSGVVEFDPKRVALRNVVGAVEDIGFNALVMSTSTDPNAAAPSADATNSQLESLKRTREIQRWRKLFWNAFALGFPVFTVSMILPKSWTAPQVIPGLSLGVLLMGALTTPIQFGVGRTFYESAFKSARHGTYTMDVLVVLGTSIAYFFSVLQTLRAIVMRMDHAPEVFFETSATLITFVTLGRYLENIAKAKTSDAISKLMSLTPSQTTILVPSEGGEAAKPHPSPAALAAPLSPTSAPIASLAHLVEKKIPVELLHPGDLVKVIPGERVAADGTVEHGASSVDESHVTGESRPIEKRPGDAVISGTLNQTGVLYFRATRVGGDTTLAQILRLVGESQSAKAPIQDVADWVAGYFVPAVVTLSLATFFFWFLVFTCTQFHPHERLGDGGPLYIALKLGISVVIVACPCALGLATPTAIMVGTGVGARLGVLIKGGRPLSVARRLNKVVFDKTGTLTEGRMAVCGQMLEASSGLDEGTVLAMLAVCEQGSEHPVGKALYAHGAEQQLGLMADAVELEAFEAVPGSGVSCVVRVGGKRRRVMVGSQKFVEAREGAGTLAVVPDAAVVFATRNQSEGRTVVFMASEPVDLGTTAGAMRTFLATFAIADQIRASAAPTVKGLRRMGIDVVMITGDHALSAQAVAAQVGISEVHSGISPAGKRALVRRMQEEGACVAMVGDGINDSASIAQSDMGVSLGGGTDVAVEAADVVIMRDDLAGVVVGIDLCRTITRRIVMNFVWATA